MQDARVVVAGAGIAGASIAFHLAQLGWSDVVVLDQGELVHGTTSHAPGLVGQLRASASLAKMLMYSVTLYRWLSVDGVPGFLGEGSLRLASSPARWRQLQQQAEHANALGLEAYLIPPDGVAQLCPLVSLGGIEGALLLPTDGSATAPVLAQALIREAKALGVTFSPRTRVLGVDTTGGRVRAVETASGRISAEILVIACGIWSPLVGRLAGVAIPLTPMQHQYAVTAPLPEGEGKTIPNLRDPDKLVYLRQNGTSLVLGGYERDPRTFDAEAIPDGADPTVRPFDAEHFQPLLRAAAERIPLLAHTSLVKQVNGLEAFTPDGEFLLGPAPEVAGVWAACGFCAHGVSGAGGVGKVMAEWIAHGDPGLDLSAMALSRFVGRAPDAEEIRRRARAVYATYYDITT
jgi:4-methylaminobutanoate oxidase (formaldehyde-forming)